MQRARLTVLILALILTAPAWTDGSERHFHGNSAVMVGRGAPEPSLWGKFTSGTTTLLTKTRQTLFPWTREPEKPVRGGYRSPKRAPEKKSFFSSWFQSEEEQPIQSVNEFLALPRLEP